MRAQREATLTCGLPRHPNLVYGLDSGTDRQGCHYLAMQLVPGQSLQEVLMERGRLEWREAVTIALQLAGALGSLAASGVVHRDVKPDNIMVSDDGEYAGSTKATLIDLGLARRACDADDDDGSISCKTDVQCSPRRMLRVRTPAFSAVGSPAFMAPEQVTNARCATTSADIYGLGATLYVSVTGRLPFDGSNAVRTMQQVLAGDLRSPSQFGVQLPPAVELLIMRMLAREAAKRPPSGLSLEDALRHVLERPNDVIGVQAILEGAAQECAFDRRRWWAWCAATVAFAAVVLTVALKELLALRPDSEDETMQYSSGWAQQPGRR